MKQIFGTESRLRVITQKKKEETLHWDRLARPSKKSVLKILFVLWTQTRWRKKHWADLQKTAYLAFCFEPLAKPDCLYSGGQNLGRLVSMGGANWLVLFVTSQGA